MNKKYIIQKSNSVTGLVLSLLLFTLTLFGQKNINQNHEQLKVNVLIISSERFKRAVISQDTASQIQSLVDIAYYYGNQAKYKNSYDNLWKALFLADESKNFHAKINLYQRIGRHYGYYRRKEEGLSYFKQALDIRNQAIKQDSSKKHGLADTYLNMCAFYRDLDDLVMQKQCLDSCKKYMDKVKNLNAYHRLVMEEAIIATGEKNYKKAEKLFDQIYSPISQDMYTYLVLFEYYQGVNYWYLKKTNLAKEKLNHALKVAYENNAHLDFVPKIYKKLSDIYIEEGETEKAIITLNKLAEVNFDFFDSRSERNTSLLEIQDEQRRYKEKQEEEIQLIRLDELEQARKILFFQRTLLIGGIFLMVLFGFLYVNFLVKKYQLDKKLEQKKQEIEIEKVRELIELKNKELATSALKLIQKDEIVEQFGASLKSKNWKPEPKELKQFLKSWDLNTGRNWEEFQTRFTSINSSFYKKLHEAFPKLSTSDDKLCALIKLKLSSKEIAQLLGLSNESVQTKRSRLRTKMGLERSVNLTAFMDKF